jgi:hypothetical protein
LKNTEKVMRSKLLLSLFLFLPACRAFSSAALLLEEPFGAFGYVNPTGHAAVYLSRVCAESPVELRRCRPDEPGVVISRYHRVGGYDWLAIPLIPYLYSVDNLADIPQTASPEVEADLRDAWRRKHLEALVPDTNDGRAPGGEWIQLVGALYDRKIFAYELETTTEQDDAFIQAFNKERNRSHFNLFFHNCADFSRSVLDFYYPHSVRRSYSADLGMTTPKQLAKSLVRYSARHERIEMQEFILPQVQGTISRSKHVDGVLEAVLRKKYVLPIALLNPYVAAGFAVTYMTGGRYDPAKNAVALDPGSLVQTIWLGEPRPQHTGRGLVAGTGAIQGIQSTPVDVATK